MNEIVLTEKKRVIQAFSMRPTSYCKNISETITTIRQVFEAPAVQLNELDKECHDKLYAVLVRFIQGMLCFYGRDENDMSDTQVKMIVDEIVRKYYFFRLEDVCLCFKKARSEKAYKDFYGRIDGSVILSWFSTYDKQRDEVIHSLPTDSPTMYADNGITREEWEEISLAKAAGGDYEAYKARICAENLKKEIWKGRYQYANYKYNQIHKFDEKRHR